MAHSYVQPVTLNPEYAVGSSHVSVSLLACCSVLVLISCLFLVRSFLFFVFPIHDVSCTCIADCPSSSSGLLAPLLFSPLGRANVATKTWMRRDPQHVHRHRHAHAHRHRHNLRHEYSLRHRQAYKITHQPWLARCCTTALTTEVRRWLRMVSTLMLKLRLCTSCPTMCSCVLARIFYPLVK